MHVWALGASGVSDFRTALFRSALTVSFTEIVCALGFGDWLIGRSHECDFPKSVSKLPVLTKPKLNVDDSSREID